MSESNSSAANNDKENKPRRPPVIRRLSQCDIFCPSSNLHVLGISPKRGPSIQPRVSTPLPCSSLGTGSLETLNVNPSMELAVEDVDHVYLKDSGINSSANMAEGDLFLTSTPKEGHITGYHSWQVSAIEAPEPPNDVMKASTFVLSPPPPPQRRQWKRKDFANLRSPIQARSRMIAPIQVVESAAVPVVQEAFKKAEKKPEEVPALRSPIQTQSRTRALIQVVESAAEPVALTKPKKKLKEVPILRSPVLTRARKRRQMEEDQLVVACTKRAR